MVRGDHRAAFFTLAALAACKSSSPVTSGPIAVAIAPDTVSVQPGATQAFTATVTGTADTAVTWSVEEAGGGAIDASGKYTAPSALGTYHVDAVAHADATKNARATVTVADVAITVSPATPTVHAGATQAFTATVHGADPAVDWSAPEGGAIGADGVFTAPVAAGSYHVVATSHAVPTASGAATVTVPDGIPAAPGLVNLAVSIHGDTAHLTFEPVDGAKDYRVYPAPALADVTVGAGGAVTIHNATYRCAGDREAFPIPTDAEPQVGSGYIRSVINGDVEGFTRSAAGAILGYVYVTPGPGLTPVWAMGSPTSDNVCYFQRFNETRGKQYVTADADRAALLAARWRDDGIAFYAPAAGAGTVNVSTALADKDRLYFVPGAELTARAGLTATSAFPVLTAQAAGTQPLYRVHYAGDCGGTHDEMVAGKPRFDKAVHEGLTPIPALTWSGLTGPATLVVEALDSGCPFQGHLSPQAIASDADHQAFLTLDQLRAADAHGEVFVNGQHEAANRPKAIARSLVNVAPAALEAMDFSDDFSAAGTVDPLTVAHWPGGDPFNSFRYDTPAYDVTFYSLDVPEYAIGRMLGELWVSYADYAADTNGKFRMTVKQQATLSASAFLHVMDEVDMVTTDRRYPQILVSTLAPPVQDSLATGSTLLLQTFASWPSRIDLEMCDHRTWDVNNQCPRFYIEPIALDPFAGDPLPPHAEVSEHAGVDRRVRFDLYVSTARAYIFFEGQPWACAKLPATGGMPAGPVSVTFGDVLYHSGVDVEDPPYTFHRAHLYTETRRHFDAVGFKSGVPAPAWDENRLPCATKFAP